jgi:hypothetical protein
MKATKPSCRHTCGRLVHWTLGALVTLVVLTFVVLGHALSSSVAQGAETTWKIIPNDWFSQRETNSSWIARKDEL